MTLLLPARYSSPKVLTPLHYSSGQTALKPFHPMEWNRFAGFLCSCDLREEPRAGQVWFPSPCGFFPAFLGVLGGGEAKGRWPLLRRRQQFVPWPWRWARGTRVWIPPKEGRSHRSSSGAGPAQRPPPGEAGGGQPHFIHLHRTAFSNKNENQAVPLLCDGRDLV